MQLVSLYIPPERKIYDVQSYLRNESSQSANIKSKSTRKNWFNCQSRQDYFQRTRSDVSKGSNQTTMVQEVIEHFYTDVIPASFLGGIRRSQSTIWFNCHRNSKYQKHMYSQVPSKHGKGGQSKQRFERLIEEAAHEWYKKVAHSATECFLGNNVEGLLIGGPGATKDYFIKREYLNHELQKIIIDSFDTGYTDESGLREIVTRGAGRLSEVQLVKEKNLMNQFMKEVLSTKGNLATYGQKQIEMALEMGAVDHLLVSEGFEKMPNVEQGTVKRLGEMAEKSKATVTIISTDSEEGISLQKAFGGLAAMLRYPIS